MVCLFILTFQSRKTRCKKTRGRRVCYKAYPLRRCRKYGRTRVCARVVAWKIIRRVVIKGIRWCRRTNGRRVCGPRRRRPCLKLILFTLPSSWSNETKQKLICLSWAFPTTYRTVSPPFDKFFRVQSRLPITSTTSQLN